MSLKRKMKKGFTLVELVVVIAVIAILSAVSVGAYFGITESAKNSKADQEAKAVHTAIMLVVNDPNSGWGLDATYKLVDTDDENDTTFVEELNKMYGLTLKEVTFASDKYSVTFGSDDAGAVYAKANEAKVYYVTTDKIAREITLKNGDIKPVTLTWAA